MTRNSCANCRHSRYDEKQTDTLVCRRYPPKMYNTQRINPISKAPEIGQVTVFTPVDPGMFCGEWIRGQEKTPPKPKTAPSPLVIS